MFDTSIHDAVVAQLATASTRCDHMREVQLCADSFVTAAQLYVSARDANADSAEDAFHRAAVAYGCMIDKNAADFDMRTDGGFASVSAVVRVIQATSPAVKHAWSAMVDACTNHCLDKAT